MNFSYFYWEWYEFRRHLHSILRTIFTYSIRLRGTVVKVPKKDEWYIVYHRFSYPTGIKMGDAGGFHREVAIDKLEFNTDGSIRQVVPTHAGINPVKKN